jgi:hypothetical protein
MTEKPQFEHKNPQFFPAGPYNVALASLVQSASWMRPEGNDSFSFGLMALPGHGAAAGGGPGQTGISQ